ncbi:MAG: hypothetical protein AAF597_03720 [Bacteroidota bacterium]
MTISEKLKDPDLSPEEEAEIIGAFVRRQKREALGKRWAQKLASEHNVKRSGLQAVGEQSPRTRRRLLWILPAVAAAILLLVLLLPQLQGPVQSRSDLVAMSIVEAEIPTFRGGAEGEYAELRAAFARQYNAGDYAAAIQTGTAILADSSAQTADELSLGLAYLNADQHETAAIAFRKLLVTTPKYRTEATFYLALALLKGGQEAEALDLLAGIRSEDGKSWYRKAQAILSAD